MDRREIASEVELVVPPRETGDLLSEFFVLDWLPPRLILSHPLKLCHVAKTSTNGWVYSPKCVEGEFSEVYLQDHA
jgi:hypothetical protein